MLPRNSSLKKEGNSCQLHSINACSLEWNQYALFHLHQEAQKEGQLFASAKTGILVFLALGHGRAYLGASWSVGSCQDLPTCL